MTEGRASLLILGATGHVGRLLRGVWPADAPVIWHSRTPMNGFAACDLLAQPRELTDVARECAAILCLAGVTGKRHRQSGQAYDDNSRLAQAAIVAAKNAGCSRVFLCSSAAVYGRTTKLCVEEDTGEDVSEYGRAKIEMEATGLALGQALGVEVSCLRIGNIAGADAILGQWDPDCQLDTFNDGSTPSRSYIGATILADILIGLARSGAVPPILNVAQPGTVSMGDLLDAAGLSWQARPATENTIKSVELSTGLLEQTLRRTLPLAAAKELAQEHLQLSKPRQSAG